MADWNNQERIQKKFESVPRTGGEVNVSYDEGLRSYMLSIYNYMCSAVLLTGIVALVSAESGFTASIMGTPLWWVVVLAPLGFILAINFGLAKMSKGTLGAIFWAFAVVFGLSISTIFYRFTNESIALTFFATSGAFAGLSLFGYTTKKDLSGLGTFLIMGLVGIIIAMIVNIFLQSGTLAFVISALGVLIFAGLTAYDTQRLKEQYAVLKGTDFIGKAVILGALTLYLDFINMFMFLLNFLGSQE